MAAVKVGNSTMVERLRHCLKIQGSNPGTGTERDKEGKNKGGGQGRMQHGGRALDALPQDLGFKSCHCPWDIGQVQKLSLWPMAVAQWLSLGLRLQFKVV